MQQAVPLNRRDRARRSNSAILHGLLAILLALGWCAPAPAADTPSAGSINTRFAAIAFHDVIDPGQPATDESVRIETLVGFLRMAEAGWLDGHFDGGHRRGSSGREAVAAEGNPADLR